MLVSSAICSLPRPAPDANVNKSEGHYLRWVDLGEGEVADIPTNAKRLRRVQRVRCVLAGGIVLRNLELCNIPGFRVK